jgi:hypothetical protein
MERQLLGAHQDSFVVERRAVVLTAPSEIALVRQHLTMPQTVKRSKK